jgi:demethylmenaquinone methyltransferase/2-methoxy-6-polyprenyl-1,4-benzoquinol methylase
MRRVDATPEPVAIRQMFDEISGSYDRLNDLMTAGLHHRWRELAVVLARVKPGDSVLDVCCGTGDMAFAVKRAVGPTGTVVGIDVSEDMLEVAREKSGRNQLYVDFRLGDVLALDFESGGPAAADVSPGGASPGRTDDVGVEPEGRPQGFDACTVGFGVRNVPDVLGAFAEMRRVCRPGAKVVCLEITHPQIPVFKQFYRLWFDRIVPVLGKVAAGEKKAYTYLPASVRRFPPPDELQALMQQAGLQNVRYEILAAGIIAVHHGVV